MERAAFRVNEERCSTMDAQYTVVIADDSAFARKVVNSYLADSEFKVVASVECGAAAIKVFEELKPHLVLLDCTMPDLSGVDALGQIMKISSDARVVMVSSMGTESTVTECLSRGAKAFVQKPTNREALLACLRKVMTE